MKASGAVTALRDRERFVLRYYEWARGEWDAELSSGLARLRALPSKSLRVAAGLLARRSPAEQARISQAMLKRFHPEACRLLDTHLSQPESALLDEMRDDRLASFLPTPGLRIDKKRLRRGLMERLSALTGQPPDTAWDLGVEWRHVQRWGAVSVQTYIDTGGRPSRQVEYNHALRHADGSELQGWISLGSWLGLSSVTRFDSIAPGEEDAAVDQVVSLAKHFIDALPRLLE